MALEEKIVLIILAIWFVVFPIIFTIHWKLESSDEQRRYELWKNGKKRNEQDDIGEKTNENNM